MPDNSCVVTFSKTENYHRLRISSFYNPFCRRSPSRYSNPGQLNQTTQLTEPAYMTVDGRLAVTLGASLVAIYSYYFWMSRRVMRRAPVMPMGPEGDAPTSDPNRVADQCSRSSPFEPTISDVLVMKAMLIKALHLPPEVIDTIADHAEYWPHTSTAGRFDLLVRGSSDEENKFLLRSLPLGLHRWKPSADPANNASNTKRNPQPRAAGEEFPTEVFQELVASPQTMLAHPCRRIVFTIQSHDQGWGGSFPDHGTYNGSWTWFEAGLERWCKTSPTESTNAGEQAQIVPPHEKPSLKVEDLCTVWPEIESNAETGAPQFYLPIEPNENLKIQCNVMAKREPTEHRVVWSYTDDISPERDVEASAKLAESGRGTATGNGKFVRNLKLGDVVTVWAKARFAAWYNAVESVKIDVYYAI